MARIILVSGKGGVGKTTVSAATALGAAERGHRTLAISFDVAHSLSDSFGLERDLFDQNRGLPFTVAPNLDIQEIDVQEEVERNWGPIRNYLALALSSMGVSDVVADEISIIPGMEDVVTLMYLNQYVRAGTYDTIVIDAPPTGESLRFVSLTSTLEWYVRKRFRRDRTLMKVARPLASKFSDMPLPNDAFYEMIRAIVDNLEGVEDLLVDPRITSVRLVTNPERMVIRETQRAFMYFTMYGMVIDQVIINRLLSPDSGSYARWAETQAAYSDEIRAYFRPVDVASVPLFAHEIVGQERLSEVTQALYADRDPAQVFRDQPPYAFSKANGRYQLELALPFARKEDVEMNRREDDLMVKIGSFQRHIPLPRSVARLRTAGATMRNNRLVVQFAEE